MARDGRHRCWWVEAGWYGVLVGEVVTYWHVSWSGVPDQVGVLDADGRRGTPLLCAVGSEIEMSLQKGTSRRIVGVAGESMTDPEWSVLYPQLFAHLTQTVWEDGTARQTSSLSLFADGAMAKCVLKDREAGLCLWAASKSFSELFGVVEALLSDPAAEWRVDRVSPGTKASRVKR